MCEVVLVVEDTTDPDFYVQCGACYQAGDIIEVMPDGFPWQKGELNHPKWRILKFPGVPVEKFLQFTTPQQAVDENNPPKTLLRRAIKFDYENLQAVAKVPSEAAKVDSFIEDAARTDKTLTVQVDVKSIVDLSIAKEIPADPVVIGADQHVLPTVIG